MNVIVKAVAALADVPAFLKETGAETTYGECHTALTWLAIRIRRSHLEEFTVWLCEGTFARQDHSWIQIEDTDTGEQTIIDMTVDQFGEFPVPYVGPICPGYVIYRSCLLSDESYLKEFIEGLG